MADPNETPQNRAARVFGAMLYRLRTNDTDDGVTQLAPPLHHELAAIVAARKASNEGAQPATETDLPREEV